MHGESPSDAQISTMIQIAKTLEYRDYGNLYHSNNPYEIDFFRRHEGDALLRQMSDPGNIYEFRDEVSHYLNHIDKVALPHDLYDGHDLYSSTKSVLKAPEPDMSHEVEHDHDKGFSL